MQWKRKCRAENVTSGVRKSEEVLSNRLGMKNTVSSRREGRAVGNERRRKKKQTQKQRQHSARQYEPAQHVCSQNLRTKRMGQKIFLKAEIKKHDETRNFTDPQNLIKSEKHSFAVS